MTLAQTASFTERRSSRWLLLGSLALNLFFIGVAIAMAIRGPVPPPTWDRNVFVRAERIAATLPPSDTIGFTLNDPDFITANQIASAINRELGDAAARPIDSATVSVRVPATYRSTIPELLARLEPLPVQVGREQRAVVVGEVRRQPGRPVGAGGLQRPHHDGPVGGCLDELKHVAQPHPAPLPLGAPALDAGDRQAHRAVREVEQVADRHHQPVLAVRHGERVVVRGRQGGHPRLARGLVDRHPARPVAARAVGAGDENGTDSFGCRLGEHASRGRRLVIRVRMHGHQCQLSPAHRTEPKGRRGVRHWTYTATWVRSDSAFPRRVKSLIPRRVGHMATRSQLRFPIPERSGVRANPTYPRSLSVTSDGVAR